MTIRTYRIHYRVFWKLADDPESFDRTTEERAFSADDALVQARVRLDSLCRNKKALVSNFPQDYEITKIEPEVNSNDR